MSFPRPPKPPYSFASLSPVRAVTVPYDAQFLGWVVVLTFVLLKLPCFSYMFYVRWAKYNKDARAVAQQLQLVQTAQAETRMTPDKTCCSQLDRPATSVYLFVTTIEASNSVSSSSPNRNDVSDIPTEQPLEDGAASDSLLQSASLSHWAMEIRETKYELLRQEGATKIELHVTKKGQEKDVTALGIPLSRPKCIEIGTTFLPDDEIMKLFKFEQKAMLSSESHNRYHPFANNCQTVWTSGLLKRIVCQCPDQPGLRLPKTVEQHHIPRAYGILAHSISFFLIVLHRRGLITLPSYLSPACSYGSIYLHIFAEVMKYVGLLGLIGNPDVEYVVQEKALSSQSYYSDVLSSPRMQKKPWVVRKILTGVLRRHDDVVDREVIFPHASHDEDNQDRIDIEASLKLKEARSDVGRHVVVLFFSCLFDSAFGFLHRFTTHSGFMWCEIAMSIVITIISGSLYDLSSSVGVIQTCSAQAKHEKKKKKD